MNVEIILLFSFGVIAITSRIAIAIFIPEPNQNQEAVFRTFLSIACAGIAAIIPGTIEFSSEVMQSTLSATGAIGVFAFVYLTNPNTKNSGHRKTTSSNELESLDARISALEEMYNPMIRE